MTTEQTDNKGVASVTEFKTLTETEVLRRERGMVLRCLVGIAVFAFSTILVVVVAMSYFNAKAMGQAVNAAARGLKYEQVK